MAKTKEKRKMIKTKEKRKMAKTKEKRKSKKKELRKKLRKTKRKAGVIPTKSHIIRLLETRPEFQKMRQPEILEQIAKSAVDDNTQKLFTALAANLIDCNKNKKTTDQRLRNYYYDAKFPKRWYDFQLCWRDFCEKVLKIDMKLELIEPKAPYGWKKDADGNVLYLSDNEKKYTINKSKWNKPLWALYFTYNILFAFDMRLPFTHHYYSVPTTDPGIYWAIGHNNPNFFYPAFLFGKEIDRNGYNAKPAFKYIEDIVSSPNRFLRVPYDRQDYILKGMQIYQYLLDNISLPNMKETSRFYDSILKNEAIIWCRNIIRYYEDIEYRKIQRERKLEEAITTAEKERRTQERKEQKAKEAKRSPERIAQEKKTRKEEKKAKQEAEASTSIARTRPRRTGQPEVPPADK